MIQTFCRCGPFLGLLSFAFIMLTASDVFAQSSNSPPKVGSKAPDFELAVQGEKSFVSLSGLVKDGPVVVVVLRGFPGYQCSLCNRQVSSLINRAKAISAVTGNKPRRVVLVYPGPDIGLESKARSFMGSRKLPDPFVMVRDPGMQMVTDWGLRWDARRETAYPATFVIDSSLRVRWSEISRSHAGRVGADQIVKAIKNL